VTGKRKKLGKIDYKKFVDTFNNLGKIAAVKYVTEIYGVRYDTIVKRLKKESDYIYSQQDDRYVLKTERNDEGAFLTMEELCKTEKSKEQKTIPINFDDILFDLIKDKFMEMSKFITLESSNKKLLLKLDAARIAGYVIEYL
jgi:hypothetical protein